MGEVLSEGQVAEDPEASEVLLGADPSAEVATTGARPTTLGVDGVVDTVAEEEEVEDGEEEENANQDQLKRFCFSYHF